MADAHEPARCPCGHDDTVKLLSTAAVGGRSGAEPVPAWASARRQDALVAFNRLTKCPRQWVQQKP